ncbi:MAG: aminoglycoside phosphotransferase family protein [Saprospiraceae bacterium]
MAEVEHIAAQFLPYSPEELTVQPITGGLINKTFLVAAKNSPDQYVLQQVNHHIFQNPDAITRNVEQVNSVLTRSGYPLKLFHFLKTRSGAFHFYDTGHNPWRMLSHIENSATFDRASTPEMARRGAAAFSLFYRHLNESPGMEVVPVLPDFINFRKRVTDYRTALSTGLPERFEKAESLISRIDPNLSIPDQWIEWQDSGRLPRRVIHADPKISNVLFHAEKQTALAVIDLDTLMHGTLLYDFGDMARSYSNTTEEDNSSVASPFNTDLYLATKAGFLSHLADVLEPVERENLDYGAQVVVFVQCLRFLTDYLNGDTYYQVAHPEQNLHRAFNQFNLFWGMKGLCLVL